MRNLAAPVATRPAFGIEIWRRRLLIAVVPGYVGALIVSPLAALVNGAFAQGIGPILTALTQPDVFSSFLLTLQISLIVVGVHVVFGTITAWMLVRDRFAGSKLLNALIDMPFAVSPVVVGYMLLLLFGRNGLLAPLLAALGWQVAFAWSGLVLATLFVTLPFMVRELAPALKAFGVQQEQAAVTLGVGPILKLGPIWRAVAPK